MAATAAPYGLLPVNLLGGQVYAGSTRHIAIASALAQNLFLGEPVLLVTSGTIEEDVGTATLTPVGIFMGCTYTDPNLGYKLYNQLWPTGTVATDAEGYICDDPDIVMRAQADAALTQTALGNNIGLNAAAGSTLTKHATTSLDVGTLNVTATLPLRIVGFVDGPDSAVGDAFTDVYVKWNFGIHLYETALGI